jgi:hypothetical protein
VAAAALPLLAAVKSACRRGQQQQQQGLVGSGLRACQMLATVRQAPVKPAAASAKELQCSAAALLEVRQAKQGLARTSLPLQAASSSSSNDQARQELRVLGNSREQQQVRWAGLQQLQAADRQAKQAVLLELATAARSRQLLARAVAARIGVAAAGC